MATTGSVTLTLPGSGEGHRFGVNGVLLSSIDAARLYTAGRDGTVRCWSVNQAERAATLLSTLDEHTDWVNGIVRVDDASREAFATCSSDRTVKLWAVIADEAECGSTYACETLGRHDDYAKAIAYAPRRGILASVGCDCRILLW